MTSISITQFKALQKPKKRNPDPAPTIPPNLIKGFASDRLFEDDLLMCEIEIVPPSVNNYWLDSGRGRKRLSKRARHFTAVMKRFINPCRYDGLVSLSVQFAPPDKVVRDLDNMLKPILDSLSKCGLILDDRQVDDLAIKRLPIQQNGKLIISVKKI
ncbi:MAG: RusA family crossover junction endodeoxyribonuclease [Candidatus Acinetobacter avistercoris]|nr:RusA family crossover junction endodeoxyribonuclease [Candidatus Acinetobacter avistercoris]